MSQVTIQIDGVLYTKVMDPKNASYGVEDPLYAITQLAQTTMRSELGKITLDKTFEERESLNRNIVESINQASQSWGISCLRYEIRDISPPVSVKAAMDLQAEAERRKRAEILESEVGVRVLSGVAAVSDTVCLWHWVTLCMCARVFVPRAPQGLRAAAINKAEGMQRGTILQAEGDAQAIVAKAQATGVSPARRVPPCLWVRALFFTCTH